MLPEFYAQSIYAAIHSLKQVRGSTKRFPSAKILVPFSLYHPGAMRKEVHFFWGTYTNGMPFSYSGIRPIPNDAAQKPRYSHET